MMCSQLVLPCMTYGCKTNSIGPEIRTSKRGLHFCPFSLPLSPLLLIKMVLILWSGLGILQNSSYYYLKVENRVNIGSAKICRQGQIQEIFITGTPISTNLKTKPWGKFYWPLLRFLINAETSFAFGTIVQIPSFH